MKKPLLRFCVLLAAALALLPAVLLCCAFLLPAQYGQTFLGEMPDKLARLQTTPGRRIVVVGGSSVPFGLDSALLESQLPGYTVVDFGLYADMGTVVMLDWAQTEVHEGDLFIVMPEQNPQTLSCYVGAGDVWQASDGAFGQLCLLPSSRWGALATALPAFAGNKLGYFFTGAPQPGGVYARASFNEYGDIAYPDREYNILAAGYDPNSPVSFAQAGIDAAFIEELNAFARTVAAGGGTVLYHFSPINAAALLPGTTRAEVDSYYDFLQEALLFPILGDPNRCILDSGWFYDTNFHLNASGAVVFTRLLAEDIKLYLQDTSVTDIALPAMPAAPAADIWGDDSDADRFTYRRTESGWIIDGLTQAGQAAAQLTVPTHYNGEPVVGMDADVFAGNGTLARLTLQPNAGALYDGMFAGCTGLRALVLTGERPSAYPVGDGLRTGADFVIYVPQNAIDTYRRDYAWQKYEAWLLPFQN